MAVGYDLNIGIPARTQNTMQQPAALASNATDEQKAAYWTQMDKWWQAEAEARLSHLNASQAALVSVKAQYPDYTQDEWQSQVIADYTRQAADAQNAYNEAKRKADTINVNVGVSTSKNGDNEQVDKTYTITDDTGNTVATKYSTDNGGMSAAELRAKQESDQQKALTASNAKIAADAAQLAEQIQGGAERDYAIGNAKSNIDAYQQQYNRDLATMDKSYASDKLQGNQDLLLASNETYRNAINNSKQANSILGQYSLGGSSLGPRLNQIASEAANTSNQSAALAYMKHMNEADTNYGESRTKLEDTNAAQQNTYNQAVAQARADYLSRAGTQAGKNAQNLSQYANPDYWYGTMYDAQGNRLNSFANMNSQQMQDYASRQAAKYTASQNAYAQQQKDYANQQTNTKADQYVSGYTVPAAKTYDAGLKAYTPVNSTTSLFGQTQPYLDKKDATQ